MTTLFAWLIANIKAIFWVLLIITYEILLWTGVIQCNDLLIWSVVFIVFFLIFACFVGGYPARGIGANLYNLAALIILYVIVIILYNYAENAQAPALIWGGIPVLIFAIVVAVFTATHMDEVADLSMIITSSNTEMLEVTALYTFDRFVATIHIGTMLCIFWDIVLYFYQTSTPIDQILK